MTAEMVRFLEPYLDNQHIFSFFLLQRRWIREMIHFTVLDLGTTCYYSSLIHSEHVVHNRKTAEH